MASSVNMFAPLSAVRKRTRLAKMGRYLEDSGMQVQFFGWERVAGEAELHRWQGSSIKESVLLRGGGYASKKARLMYPVWMFAVFFRVLLLPRASKCWCLGWETAFPARLAAIFRRSTIIFDDADRFSMLLKLPKPVHKFLVRLEKWTSMKCYRHVVPGWTRYEWKHEGMTLLRNTPMSADYEEAMRVPRTSLDQGLSVYVNGWIAWDTGSRIIIKAIDELARRNLSCRVLVAGRISSDDGQQLIEHSYADFRGELPQVEALKLYRQSSIALTLYDPSVAINHHAESNKWGDCVFLGTPFIVNSEVATAQRFVDAGAAFSFRYNDHMALADLLEQFLKEPQKLDNAQRSLKSFEGEFSAFENQLEPLFSDFLAA
ncbi:Glycosyltransferase involved in cell wall bisynthesis [Shimia gijangensis]|uniref:Glycosyltransferase involved in cell wall bisynthesis n=1 Tax=Shimia gijangensis TaxID=1470563 RepID=A0A1M6SEP4_9RHOB|nr:glycosyltransferase family 4 protein [Shimia gijangensis]SHK42968.1 Glycosyltransferase involved in cell wall bisynthesis [Shimia gijangensis]